MLHVNHLIGFGAGRNGGALSNVISGLGLTGNLKLCLDAGDAASYTSGQPWLDRSGNGYDFNRGSGSGTDAADPTFNGAAGSLGANEYFSFDGGDYLTYDSANETWMQNLHKDNALATFVGWVYLSTPGTAQRLLGTRGSATSHTGIIVAINSNLFWVATNSGSNALVATSAGTLPTTTWCMAAISIDEAAGAGASIFFINGATETFDGTYASPASGNASYTMNIGAGGNGDNPLPGGSRVGMLAMWEGRALTAGQLNQIYQATRGRYGV